MKQKNGGKRRKEGESLFVTFLFYTNYINSWFKNINRLDSGLPESIPVVPYLGWQKSKSNWNVNTVLGTLINIGPNATGTLTLFLGLCPTL